MFTVHFQLGLKRKVPRSLYSLTSLLLLVGRSCQRGTRLMQGRGRKLGRVKFLAALILGIALTKIGFEPNQVQTEETLAGLKFLMSWIPLTGVCLSFVLVYFYPIDKAFHEKLIQDIQEKRLLNE